MSQFPSPFQRSRPFDVDYGQQLDAGVVARFFNSVYAWMAAGLAITAAVAWWVSSRPEILQSFGLAGLIVLLIVDLALVFIVGNAIERINATTATVLFLVYSAINGLLLSGVLLVYTHAIIASAFIVTAGMFAAVSVYGFVTRRDLTALGAYLFMGLIGFILASIVSIFWHPTLLTVGLNYLGVLIFVGLTAFDTQRLKYIALASQNDPALAARLSISGALRLYLDFLNLFLLLLRILSDNNRR